MLSRVKRRVQDTIWHKDWSQEEIEKYIGAYRDCYFTYAADPSYRERAASGGSTSRLLAYLLETDQIDGALVLDSYVEDDKLKMRFLIAQSAEELRSAQGSKYMAVYFAAHALPLIKAFEGRLAVVALPCDATILQRARKSDPALDEKIKFVFTLLCGHNSEPELTAMIVDRLRLDEDDHLLAYQYKFGHWRGNLRATFSKQGEVIRPYVSFSDYRNLYFFAQPKCHHCYDHFGYNCDISAGDIWSHSMRHNPIKHTALITRTDAGDQLVAEAIDAGILEGSAQSVVDVLNGQARIAPTHYNISARSKVGRLLGMQIKDETQERVRWNDYLIALIALSNQRFSETAFGRSVIRIMPRFVVRLGLYFLKALESI